ncbi:hypothetical protein TNCV_1902701 [Trichonephila clavipes]|nr:hypothetical protein TNCV_1902701 [Trichonephila clavipes]
MLYPKCMLGPPFHFPKGDNGKASTGRPPLLEFCLAALCNPGLGHFCLGYLPRSEWQNLNQIILQHYQEWRDGQEANEGLNEWPRFPRLNELYECRHESSRKKDHKKTRAPAPWVKSKSELYLCRSEATHQGDSGH